MTLAPLPKLTGYQKHLCDWISCRFVVVKWPPLRFFPRDLSGPNQTCIHSGMLRRAVMPSGDCERWFPGRGTRAAKGKAGIPVPAFQSHLSAGGDSLCTFEYGLYCALVQSRSNSALNSGVKSDGRQRLAFAAAPRIHRSANSVQASPKICSDGPSIFSRDISSSNQTSINRSLFRRALMS
jgi:hypothetical protein